MYVIFYICIYIALPLIFDWLLVPKVRKNCPPAAGTSKIDLLDRYP